MASASNLDGLEWVVVESLLPAPATRGRKRSTSLRSVVDGILWCVQNRETWRNLPNEFPAWETVFGYYNKWRKNGVLARLGEALPDRQFIQKKRSVAQPPRHDVEGSTAIAAPSRGDAATSC